MIQKFLLYGCIGILIEFFFTSISSLLNKNWKATGHSYLWMFPVYAITALVLEGMSSLLPWPFFAKAFVYVPIIYSVEAFSGWILSKVIGEIPWTYPKRKWTLNGLIQPKYLPFWLFLSLCFDYIIVFVNSVRVY